MTLTDSLLTSQNLPSPKIPPTTMEDPPTREVLQTPILVTGGTSITGLAAIKALLSSSSGRDVLIVAVSRNINSPRAKALAALSPSIRLIQGDLRNCSAIFDDAEEAAGRRPIHSVFSNAQTIGPGWTAEKELNGEISLIQWAVAHDITHFVLASIDRGPPPSLDAPQLPAHFETKRETEDYLISATASNPTMTHTILRQTCVMENLGPSWGGRAFASWWKRTLAYTKPLALISARDVGHMAAAAILDWRHPAYHNRVLTLAADELTFAHASRLCKLHRGYDLPCAPDLVARWLERSAHVQARAQREGDALRWCDKLGFNTAQIPALRRLHPGLLGFADWLERDSGFADKRK